MRDAARRTVIKHDFWLAGEQGQLYALASRSDDYIELTIPNGCSVVERYKDALADLAHETDSTSLSTQIHKGPPAIIAVLHLRLSADEHGSPPFEERLASILSTLSKAVPAFDFGDLLPDEAKPMEQVQPPSMEAAPAPLGEAIPSLVEAAPQSLSEEAEASPRPMLVAAASLRSIRQDAKLGRLHRALRALEEILKREPNHPEAWSLMEELKLLERREKRRRREPNSAQTQLEAGFSYLLFERNQEAADAFTRATRIDSNHYLSHLLLGIALHREGQVSRARKAYQSAGRLCPKDNSYMDLLQALEQGKPPMPVAEGPATTRTRYPSTLEMPWEQAV